VSSARQHGAVSLPSQREPLRGPVASEAHAREVDADLNKLALRARLAVIGAGQLDAQALTDVYAGLLARALGDGHVANGAAKLLLDLARASVEADVTDPDAKPLEELTPEERVALYARLLETLGDGDEGGDGDDDCLNPGDAISPERSELAAVETARSTNPLLTRPS
jgi:hypothetical protein